MLVLVVCSDSIDVEVYQHWLLPATSGPTAAAAGGGGGGVTRPPGLISFDNTAPAGGGASNKRPRYLQGSAARVDAETAAVVRRELRAGKRSSAFLPAVSSAEIAVLRPR